MGIALLVLVVGFERLTALSIFRVADFFELQTPASFCTARWMKGGSIPLLLNSGRQEERERSYPRYTLYPDQLRPIQTL